MSATVVTNIAIEIFCSTLCLVFIICTLVVDSLKIKLNQIFIWVLLSNIAVMLSDALAFYSIGKTAPPFFLFNFIGNFFTFIFSYVIIMCFSNYINTYLSTKTKIKRTAVYHVYWICGVAIALTFLSLLNHMYFTIDENNIYHRGEMHWLSQVLGMAALMVNMVVIVKYRRLLNRIEKFALFMYIILPIVAVVVQMLVYGFVLVYIASTITITIIYVGMQAQYPKMIQEKELALTQNQIALMLSQIKPHFLYNALNAIQYLCVTEPDKAEEAVGKFARYLRGNMDSLTQKSPIPFEQELAHLQNYLTIELYRFPYLRIEYDLKIQEFALPALTLQPLVENAIKHGVTQSEQEKGTIRISTWEDELAWYLMVEDDGVGFDPIKIPQDGNSHIGIENTKKRLAVMCGGSLAIESKPRSGTRVMVRLPKEAK